MLGPLVALGANNLENLLGLLQSDNLTDNEWISENVKRSLKSAIRKKQNSQARLKQIREAVLSARTRELKNTETGDEYGDLFNRLVCKKADNLDINLPAAQQLIEEEISNTIVRQDLLAELEKSYSQRMKNFVLQNALIASKLFPDSETKARDYALLMYEFNKRQTDKFWGGNKINKIIVDGMNDKPIELMTIICTINEFDYKGGYTLRPDIDAYKGNSRVEPVPIIIDELVEITQILAAVGVKSTLTIFVADTDYTEIMQFGPRNPDNDANLVKFINNLSSYISTIPEVSVMPISDLTTGNEVFIKAQERLASLVTRLDDYDFVRIWGKRYEDAVEGMAEALGKRQTYAPSEIRKMAMVTIQKIWANNGAQGAVLADLYKTKSNILFLSTERRERDLNYALLPEIESCLPPILYLLQSAQNWNSRIIAKET